MKFLIITDHKSLTSLINKRMDELKPTLARKVIFLQQNDFDIIHKDRGKIYIENIQMNYEGIYITQILRKRSNQFKMLFKENMNEQWYSRYQGNRFRRSDITKSETITKIGYLL